MAKTLFSIYAWTYFVLLFIVFFVIIALTFLITFPFDRYRKITNRQLGFMATLMMKVSPGWKQTIKGADRFDPEKPTIFIANHQSFMDIPFIFQLPWKMKWVVKHSMTYIPVMGWMVKLTGQLTINRSSKSALKKLSNLVRPLKDLVPVMIFPEGTRSLDGEIRSFKNGAFLLAMEHGFTIQPIVIDGAHETLQSGSSNLSPKANFKMEVLEAVNPADFSGMAELKEHCRNLLIEKLEELRRSD